MHKIFMFLFTLLISIYSTGQKKMSLEDIVVNRTFVKKGIEKMRPMNDGIHYTMMENNSRINTYSYQTGEFESVFFDLRHVENPPIKQFSDYQLSSDETRILLTTDMENRYRHSFTARYYIWNSVTEELLPLSEKGKIQLAMFSPDGERVAFVRDCNIYIKNLKFGTESQVTSDGSWGKILNGIPDWVYEEEFGINKAMEWSPDSKFLAFIRFDESHVKEYSMTLYKGKEPALGEYSLYPGSTTVKYPKAGEHNSKVAVRIYDLKSKVSIRAKTGTDTTNYIPAVKWTPDANHLAILQLNRNQNRLDVLYANPNTGDTRPVFTEKNERYIDEEFYHQMEFLPNGWFVVLSERNGFAHLYLHDKEGLEITQLTKGDFDVTDFYGYDPAGKFYYYQAAAETPLRREVYFTSQDGKKKGKLTTRPGTNRAEFSKNFNYYVNFFTSTTNPETVTLHDIKGKQLAVLENNDAIIQKCMEYKIPEKEFFTCKIQDGTQLNGWMLKPPGFDPSKKYPVVMTQYSGPNSQKVTDTWQVGWEEYLAQEGFLVVCVDPRGTGARGEDFRKKTYMQLGKYESEDLLTAAKYVGGLPYADSKNMALWGWSYGGYMVALSMSKGDVFKAGIAIAPVTDWRFYDTVYTERFMRTPEENAEGYENNSPVNLADKLKGRLLLIHGTADDNVHFQNTMEYAEALVQAGVPFDMAVYTNRNHGIRGGNTRMHLYSKMNSFLREQLMEGH